VTLTRQAMDRDYVTILDYGDKGHPNHGQSAYYSPSAVITYAEQPPQHGDAAPLHIYSPGFVVSNITQDNPYPGGQNVITATISTNVPLVEDSIITILGLTGSTTASDPSMTLTSASSVFSTTAVWSNTGSDACVVVYGEADYDCAELCPAGFMCRDSIQPAATPSGFLVDSTTKDCLSFAYSSASQCPSGSQWMAGLPSVSFLKVTVDSDTVAGELYSFSLTLTNPKCRQDPPDIFIKASPICLDEIPMTTYVANMSTPSHLSGIWSVSALESRPLDVRAPSFLVYEVWQTNPFANALNEIHLKLATNVDMLAGMLLTVRGLVGAVDYGAELAVAEEGGTDVLESSGTWDNATGTLIVPFSATSSAGTDYTFSFTVKNPPCCDSGIPQVYVDSSVECFQSVQANVVLDEDNLASDVAHGIDAESAPLKIRCPVWQAGGIQQTTDHPCTDNQLDATFTLNVPIPAGALLTLTGLTDTQTADGSLTITSTPSAGAMTAGTFNQNDGTLVVPVLQDIDAHTAVSFSFTVINPPEPTSESKIGKVKISLDRICNLVPEFVLAQTNGGVIKVQRATFSAKNIGQKTPWPGAANIITITLNSAVPLFSPTVRCVTNITIAGFDGACVQAAGFALSGAGASNFDAVTWHAEDKAVSMRVKAALGGAGSTAAIFSFAIVNPIDSQPSPLIEVSAEGIPILPVAMDKDETALTDSSYDHDADDSDASGVGSTNGAIFDSVARDAEPLRVVSPAFVTRTIGQSSPYPGATNTLSVTIRPNVDISVGSVVVLSSFMKLRKELAHEAASTGAMSLSDSSTAPGSKSIADDSVYFAAYTGGTPGKGHWDDASRTLTLFVVSKLTAGSYYTLKFDLKNPLCDQRAQPVCIRARNMQVGCDSGVAITRRLMDRDETTVLSALNAEAGDAAPLLVYEPRIVNPSLIQSSPWPRADNTLTMTLSTNVPLLTAAFSPAITIRNLVGSTTLAQTLAVTWKKIGAAGSSTLNATWQASSGHLVFDVPSDTIAGDLYTAAFTLQNKPCAQEAPTAVVDIAGGPGAGVCFQPQDLTQIVHTVCSTPTMPLEILGGPCSGGGQTAAMFTLRNISQSTPYPGCSNTITVDFTINIPLRYEDGAIVEILFAPEMLVGLKPGNVILSGNAASRFFGFTSNDAGKGLWRPDMNPPRLQLKVRDNEDLEACTPYTITFDVMNPLKKEGQPQGSTGPALIQDAMPVRILAKGTGGEIIMPATMVVDKTAGLSLPATTLDDRAPLRVHKPVFLESVISQTKPYPGAQNVLTVTLAANTDLHKDSVIAIHQLSEAIAAPGNLQLSGASANQFKSMTGTVGFGTWNDCDKVLLVKPVAGLGCSGQNYTFTFQVHNPVEPQLCAEVLINATQIVEPITQSLFSPEQSSDGISTSVTCSGSCLCEPSTGALSGSISDGPGNYSNNETCQWIISAQNAPSGKWTEIDLSFSSFDTNQDARIYIYECLDAACTSVREVAVLQGDPVSARSSFSSSTGYMKIVFNTTGTDVAPGFVGDWTIKVFEEFAVTDPRQIYGEPLPGGYEMLGDTWLTPDGIYGASEGDSCPMTVWSAAFVIKNIGQSNHYPCGENTITVSLATNVPIYPTITYPGRTAIHSKIVITRIHGAEQDGLTTSGSKSLALTTSQGSYVINGRRYYNDTAYFTDGNVAHTDKGMWKAGPAELKEPSLELYMSSSASECCVPSEQDKFFVKLSFTVFNPATAQNPTDAVSIKAEGIPIIQSAMREHIREFKPMYILNPDLEVSKIVQSDPSPCALNTITVSVKLNVNLYARCEPAIVLTGLYGFKKSMFQDLSVVYPNVTNSSNATNASNVTNTSPRPRYEVTINEDSSSGDVLRTVAEWKNETAGSEATAMIVNFSSATVAKTDTISFAFVIRNGALDYQSPEAPSIYISGMDMHPVVMDRHQTSDFWPITVALPQFAVASMVQSTPFPAAQNTLELKLELTEKLLAVASCGAKLVLTGLQGACISDTNNLVTLDGSGKTKFGATAGATTDSQAKWDPSTDSLTFYLINDLAKDSEYEIEFDVRNPAFGQPSPAISIEAMGIPIPKQAIAKNPENLPPDGVFGATAVEGEPLFVRSISAASGFLKKDIEQNNPNPGDENEIKMKLRINVPLTASSPASAITVSGLRGGSARHGDIQVDVLKPGSTTGAFTSKWNDVDKVLVLDVTQDTEPGAEYEFKFVLLNSKKAQQSPTIMIETSGIVIQATQMDTKDNDLEQPLHIRAPKLTSRYAHQAGGSAWPAQDNVITLTFTPTVRLEPIERGTVSVMVTGLKGVDKPSGVVALGGSHAAKFSDCAKHNTSTCTGSQAVWDQSSKRLTMNLKAAIAKDDPVEVTFDFKNSKKGQDSPELHVELVTRVDDQTFTQRTDDACDEVAGQASFFCTHDAGAYSPDDGGANLPCDDGTTSGQAPTCPDGGPACCCDVDDDCSDGDDDWCCPVISALQLAPEPFEVPSAKRNTDEVPLLIYRSAAFAVKKIGQSPTKGTTPGATNTISVTIKPQFDLTGNKNSKITLSGLVGSVTPDATLPLLNANALFNATAQWSAKRGTLILSVAPGQTVPQASDTVISFDLTNPTIPQDGVSLVQISADGDVPISAVPMELGAGDALPLKVKAADFTVAKIGHTSNAPNAANSIHVTFQPSVILSRGRRSTLTVHGLTGSDTTSTRALPIDIAKSSAGVPIFTTPFPDIEVTFGPECKLEDNKVILLDDSGTDYGVKDPTDDTKGLEIYATEGICKGNSSKIVSYDVETRCATLDSKLCANMGRVETVEVHEGGSGYRAGPVFAAPGVAGSGLDGNCSVNDLGQVEQITLFSKGSGYAPDTEIFCPSACDTTTCGVRENSGEGVVASANVGRNKIAVAGASWDQLNGRLEMRVRDEIKTSDETEFRVGLVNQIAPQTTPEVYVMAGGSSPVGSSLLTGTAMAIAGLNTRVTGICTCAPTSGVDECTCTVDVTVPEDKDVYALKAEYQCNGGAENICVGVGAANDENSALCTDVIKQPPETCKDSCQTYHTLFEWHNIADKITAHATSGTITLEAKATGMTGDYCGAGDNLKIVFTVLY